MYQEVADNPESEFHFFHGREAAEMFGYSPRVARPRLRRVRLPRSREWETPTSAATCSPARTVLDLGSGAGLDSIIASWQVGYRTAP